MDDRFIYSYTGRKVGPAFDAPSLQDIATALGREARYAGASVTMYCVLLHSFVVADLLPPHLKVYGLLHDAAESIVGDVPRGFKVQEIKDVEDVMTEKIHKELGIPPLNGLGKDLVKGADDRALHGEVWTVGNTMLRDFFPNRDKQAENLALQYVREFPILECVRPDGLAVLDFVRRFRDYEELLHVRTAPSLEEYNAHR